MISRNTSVLNKERVFKNLVKAARMNSISKYILALVIFILGIFVLISGISSNNNLYTILGGFFAGCGVLYVVLATIQVVKAPKDILKSNPEINDGDNKYNYVFKEGSIEITVNSNSKKKQIKYTYDQIKKVTEYNDRYDILLKEHQILYVYKDGFTEEKSEDIFKFNLDKNKKTIKTKIQDETK